MGTLDRCTCFKPAGQPLTFKGEPSAHDLEKLSCKRSQHMRHSASALRQGSMACKVHMEPCANCLDLFT